MYVEKEQTNLKQMDIKMCIPLVLCSGLLLFTTFVNIIIIITYKYLYNFYMLEKRWIFIENAYSELLTLVLCSSLIKDWMMDPRHRKLLGPKDHLQLRQQVKAYLPFFFIITVFHAKIYSFIYVIFPCKINSYHTVTVNLRFP